MTARHHVGHPVRALPPGSHGDSAQGESAPTTAVPTPGAVSNSARCALPDEGVIVRRKTLTFASGLAVTALLLAACGSEDPAPGSGDSDNGGETATEAGGGDGEESTLTVATFNEVGSQEPIQEHTGENARIIE